tara:strand:- start:1252 stop:1962 length:711 start_codon:yes stop_codon:yes gene_type:complete
MKYLRLFPLLFIIACTESPHKAEMEHQKHQQTTEKHAHHKAVENKANEHMHQKSVSELIERFESTERDEYQQPEKVLAYLGDIKGKKIMDIGAGSGYFTVKLAAQGAEVVAADVNDEFLAHINQRIQVDEIQNISSRKIPFDSPALAKNEVDMVFIVNTYHHIENRVEYFTQVKSGLKDNGELIIIDFFKTELPIGPSVNHKISMDVVVKELQEAGFTIEEVNVNLLPMQYLIKAS